MYAYIQMIVLSYSWQVERWLFKAVDKNSKNAICHFLLLFVGVKSGIPQEGHLEPEEMKVYHTFFLFADIYTVYEHNLFIKISPPNQP